MEEYARYGKPAMKNIRKILLNYKKEHGLTNQQMAELCNISIPEYDKIINANKHSKCGCSIDVFIRLYGGIKFDIIDFFNSVICENSKA